MRSVKVDDEVRPVYSDFRFQFDTGPAFVGTPSFFMTNDDLKDFLGWIDLIKGSVERGIAEYLSLMKTGVEKREVPE